MNDKWTLRLILEDGFRERYEMAVDLNRETIFSGMTLRTRETMEIAGSLGVPTPGLSFDGVIEMMRKREFRKDLLTQEARRLGQRMAEYMEDSEGWHGTRRAEQAEEFPVRKL